jgi:hypothetical protein
MPQNVELVRQRVRPVVRSSFNNDKGETINYVQLQLETIDEDNRVLITRVSVPKVLEDAAALAEKNQDKLLDVPVTISAGNNGALRYRLSAMPEFSK